MPPPLAPTRTGLCLALRDAFPGAVGGGRWAFPRDWGLTAWSHLTDARCLTRGGAPGPLDLGGLAPGAGQCHQGFPEALRHH